MILIVGLGNPGEKYENTRHNIGFMVVDELARKLFTATEKIWVMNGKLATQIARKRTDGTEIILAKPQTMMNASGFAVAKLCSNLTMKQFNNLWVIHDDLDLPLGKIKIALGHGSAGHHGIDSIVEHLETADFVRFRVGIGKPGKAGMWSREVRSGSAREGGEGRIVSEKTNRHDVIDYVLEEFSGKDAAEAGKVVEKTVRAVRVALEKGIEKAMNRYNNQ